jgi:hypothetical protein
MECEVGMMGRAARDTGTAFGYLHIISDSVCDKYSEDLSNEREEAVLQGRATLYRDVENVLGHHLASG